MNKIMKLKRALNDTRSHAYFVPINNLAHDFWSQEYEKKIAAVHRSDFLRSFILAVVEQTAYMNRSEDYYYPRIDAALDNAADAVDLFDDIMTSFLPGIHGKKHVRALFKRVRAAAK